MRLALPCYRWGVLSPSEQQDQWERLATNLRVEGALLPVLDCLSGLPVVVFKGALLTRLLFGDLRRRASADNDLWVPERYAEEALSRLLSTGFCPLPGLDASRALKRAGQVALWPGGDFDAVSCDLHLAPFARGMFSVDEDVLQKHLVVVPLHGREVTTFDKPLAFVHLVAHYLQHRLERSHLWEIAVAWDSWELEEAELLELAKQTCTQPALEFAVVAAQNTGWMTRPAFAARHPRARVLLHLTDSGQKIGGESSARLLSLFLAAPLRVPRQLWSGVLLEPDDLRARYGAGSRVLQTLRRARDLLERG